MFNIKQTEIGLLEGVFINWTYTFRIDSVFVSPFDIQIANHLAMCQLHSVIISNTNRMCWQTAINPNISELNRNTNDENWSTPKTVFAQNTNRPGPCVRWWIHLSFRFISLHFCFQTVSETLSTLAEQIAEVFRLSVACISCCVILKGHHFAALKFVCVCFCSSHPPMEFSQVWQPHLKR